MGLPWPAVWRQALATADLGGAACGTSPLEGGRHYRGRSTIQLPGG